MTKKAKATVAQEDRIRKRMGELKRTMRDYCVGQDELVDIVMLAAISKQHVILFGPPGCNKSRCLTIFTKLIGADKQNLNGASSKLFRVTLDKWATPEALFGPFSPKKLTEEDRWVRNTEHTLADCDYALIEELFSANGSTLRSAVVALNERAFDNAGTRLNIPLRSAFASTNEEPHQSQAALYDRFLFRAVVDQIEVTDTDAFSKMLVMSSENEDLNDLGHILTRKDIEIAEFASSQVTVDDSIFDALNEIRAHLSQNKLILSNRRWGQGLGALKASAWLRGDTTVSPADFWIALRHILWDYAKDRAVVNKILEPFQNRSREESEADLMDKIERVFADALNSKVSDIDAVDFDPDEEDDDESDGTEVRIIEAHVEIQAALDKINGDENRNRLMVMLEQIAKREKAGGAL